MKGKLVVQLYAVVRWLVTHKLPRIPFASTIYSFSTTHQTSSDHLNTIYEITALSRDIDWISQLTKHQQLHDHRRHVGQLGVTERVIHWPICEMEVMIEPVRKNLTPQGLPISMLSIGQERNKPPLAGLCISEGELKWLGVFYFNRFAKWRWW